MSVIPNLLELQRGAITAPAGCGKTQLIADALKGHGGGKPVLVLTHTNAGKSALEDRLERAKVARGAYRVFTIDSWAVRLASRFPVRSALDAASRRLENPKAHYPVVRRGIAQLLQAGHVTDPIRSTYSRLFVDEYQDCGLDQHGIIVALAKIMPAVVFGDPLQAIFTFSGPTVDWERDVLSEFGDAGRLERPWRWENVGASELGKWLLRIRPALQAGASVDLCLAPREVEWIRLDGNESAVHLQRLQAARYKAPNKNGTVVVIGDSANPPGQRQLACVTPGGVIVEAVDLKDFSAFGQSFKPAAADSLDRLISFASEMMTQLSKKALLARVDVLQRGSARTPPSSVEAAALTFLRSKSFAAAASALRAFGDAPDVRIYRPEVFRMCVKALEGAQDGKQSFSEAVIREREKNRHIGRRIASRAVGSTLLLKGLEADVSIVLYPEKMDGRNLYVAFSRGARRLVVCSRDPVIRVA